ncbi:DUF2058 domain-containing protein [Acinetobacter qingfengensis]|uniref:Uncharacterized protein n=1 Tax=Acinetobacter qingfengensis TaxID=1262585 RepID=A0A1E7RCI9_9GAMM|nr:DUF2058 domain-containing protein [Acinetobacter qingfengensis]KAA8734981.1 DUF2058 domain-containing protein [Acinetobacter qingfengensis]OEY97068.1 hypothetical protein BJI46_11085 [Acinetobacter qingfengensis]
MVKNALQAQLLKAGLVDAKKAKKASKQAQHAQKTGQDNQQQLKAQIEQAKQEKIAKDNALNQAKQQQLEEKTLKANIIQMINQYRIQDTSGDIGYQFIDENKIKKLYVSQQIYNAVVNGSLCVAKLDNDQYAFIPKALAERIEQKLTGYILGMQQQQDDQTTDEEDPYAAYVIPDDLMW